MNKAQAIALQTYVEGQCELLSKKTRASNHGGETFQAEHYKSLGDDIALVTLKKSTGKRALMICFYTRRRQGWDHLFPSTAQAAGFGRVYPELLRIENQNFGRNFDE